MRQLAHSLRLALFVAASATLAACAAASGTSAMPARNAPARHAASSSNALLYIGARHHIETYAYPSGTQQARIRTKFVVVALCSDANGNVFVSGTHLQSGKTMGAVYEYAHGGRQPIATLLLPQRQLPVDCSSDPSTGNLAVTSYNAHNFTPQIDVYVNGSGTPQIYTNDSLGASPEPAYDDSGDLYVTSGGNVGVELLAGSSNLVKITTSTLLGIVAHAQWDGKYFALQSFTTKRHHGEDTLERVYRFSISGSTATLEGVSSFSGWYVRDAGKSWIAGNTIVATPGKAFAIWNYPQGGKAVDVERLTKQAKAVTVSAGS